MVATCIQITKAFHFYVKTGETKCFYEELQAETLVVGRIDAYEKDERSNEYFKGRNLQVQITIDETFDNDERVIDQKSSPDGEFTFTSLESGEHKFCLTPVYTDGTSNKVHRIFFDVAQGSSHDYVDSKSTKMVDDLTKRVNALYEQLDKIHWEQEHMREREAAFRDQSESTNTRVVKWSIVQLIVLIGTCVYQLRHLKSFFKIQKLEEENSRLSALVGNALYGKESFKVDEYFTLDEYKRYGRQMIVPQFGSLSAQKKLQRAKVLVVGAGGLGSPLLQYLSAAGVGTIGIIDNDTVDTSNLHRQIIHTTETLGCYKCDSAKSYINRLNPHTDVKCFAERLTHDNAFDIIDQYELILDCTDHPAIRYLISDVCVILGKTVVSGSGLKAEGQFTILNFKNFGPCYRCFYPDPPSPAFVVSCSDGGVIGPAIGIVGVAMAMEAIKVLTDFYTVDNFHPFLASYSAYPSQNMRSFKMRSKQASCISCGNSPTITKECIKEGRLDYATFCGRQIFEQLDASHRVSVQQYATIHNAGNKHILIDVRPKEQFEITSLPGSINIAWEPEFRKLDSIEKYLPPNTNKCDPIYVICRFGNDSQLAAAKLLRMGYEQTKDIIGGLNKWTDDIDQSIPKY
ncbi:cnxF [Candida oxycetoniae]|uniref:Needs CLA4 to survive protein 3 n=1 Tax=Candida oxycetoniae TaxID=497107 RepID=A0AAI9WW82_9ASCO|nr:cnxF [Candida oxycetoniae]KAI3402678.2 cnxF [Candida oxycetoniae]